MFDINGSANLFRTKARSMVEFIARNNDTYVRIMYFLQRNSIIIWMFTNEVTKFPNFIIKGGANPG